MPQGRPRLYTDDAILTALRVFHAKHRRAPYAREMRGMQWGVPSTTLLKQRFGGVPRALRLAGVPANPEGGLVKHGQCRRTESVPPIDPGRAAQITREKQAFWANGGKQPTTWVHPYARRSA